MSLYIQRNAHDRFREDIFYRNLHKKCNIVLMIHAVNGSINISDTERILNLILNILLRNGILESTTA